MKTYYGIHTFWNGDNKFIKVKAIDVYSAYNKMDREDSNLSVISQKQLETLWDIHKTLKEGEIKQV